MNSAHRKTLAAIFAVPTLKNIQYRQVEAMLLGLGCEKREGAGSRVRFLRGRVRVAIHKPHPGNELKTYQVEEIRAFLETIGVVP